jgi:hypothetical protein
MTPSALSMGVILFMRYESRPITMVAIILIAYSNEGVAVCLNNMAAQKSLMIVIRIDIKQASH